MKIVIVGGGKIGFSLTEQLSREGHDILLIDKNPKVVQLAVNTYDVMGICGSGAGRETLEKAGVSTADLVIVTTAADETNLLCCLMAKKLGATHTIARVRNPEYARQMVEMREELGLSLIINPERETAREISRLLRFPSAAKLDTFSKGRLELCEIRLVEGNYLVGHKLSELYKFSKERILVCAVQRGDDVFIPGGEFILQADDHIHITGSHNALSSFFKNLGLYLSESKKVLIIGGGKISYYLAQILQDSRVSAKVIEQSAERCRFLADSFKSVSICNGDGTDPELLREESLPDYDACVVLTGIDEENIIVALYAQSVGVQKVITKIDRLSFANMVSNMGIDSFVSPKKTISNIVVRYVRALSNSRGQEMKTLLRLVNDKIEAAEFSITSSFAFRGIPLRELTTKKSTLIAGITRNGKSIIPGGEDTLETGDDVIVVTVSGKGIMTVDEIIEN